MTGPSLHPARTPRSPLQIGLGTGLIVAVGVPVLQWATAMIFGVLDPVPPVSVWLSFALVMAGFGMPAGAAMYLATRTGAGQFARSFALAILGAAGTVPDIEEFARDPLDQFLFRTLVVSLMFGLFFGGILYAFGWPKSLIEET